MAKRQKTEAQGRLDALRACVDAQAGRYKNLRGATNLAAYLGAKGDRADEEILTEPLLASIIELVLGFPTDAYFPQYGKSGQKPDFTPMDLIAHPFVLDAKSSDLDLRAHEPQIQGYMAQRGLDYGVLFNLRRVDVFRRGVGGPDPNLSFSLLPVWEAARDEAMPGPEVESFERFCERFSYRTMGVAEKIAHVRRQPPWAARLAGDEPVEVDIEYLVEQLRTLSRELADDADAQSDRLKVFLGLHPGREHRLLEELRLLTLDIAPGTDLAELPEAVSEWRTGSELARRVWRQYLLRVSYLALTRILLYRSWEDVQFVEEYLYDGGFDLAYERLARNVKDVLEEAFAHGARRYHWLYGADNNYDWYRPREASLVEVLYRLAPVPLGKLDADVLGGLYLSYVDEIDRDRLGQFFTPRSVVRFMLDRAGFQGPEGIFRIEGATRRPRRILDFATGSGGFLVEAARRIIDDAGVRDDDAADLEEALAAIVGGFVGCEISPFPYYLTEVNLLLQVSRLLGRLKIVGESPPDFVLGVLHADTLTSKSAPDRSLEVDPSLRADRAELVRDERFDLIPLDGEKLERFRTLREDGTFDLVIGNPPYVTEANNKPLFERLRAIPAWSGVYRGKTDYLYYFLLLAVEKVAPGGRLCVVIPAGWMNAGAADFLREKLAGELRLDELFLFGSYRLFAPEQGAGPTPTVESAILVATKTTVPAKHKLRVVALEDELEAARALSGNPALRAPDRDVLLEAMKRRAKGKSGRKGGIHVHDLAQSELGADRPWPVKYSAKDLARRVVAHLQGSLDESTSVEPLQQSWKAFTGIETAADAYTARIQKRLSAAVRGRLETDGARTGDPIMELPPGQEKSLPWSEHPDLLSRSPEARAILYAAVDEDDYTSFIRLDRGDDPPESFLRGLESWRPVLETRAEISRNSARKWWETAWPRDGRDLDAPKVMALYRTDRGRFALDESGEWKPGKKITAVVGRSDDAPVAYLCGLLNSELLDLWYAVRGKAPRDVWRNYEPKRMNEMPYRRPEGDPRADEIAGLVREIAANRRALLPHRPVVQGLTRIVKDPWKTGPVVVDRAALLAELPAGETVSVRLDRALDLTVNEAGTGRPVREDPSVLVFRRAKVETARVAGDPGRLDLLEELVGDRAPADLGAVLLPKGIAAFAERARERTETVAALLEEGRRLVERVERLVCALYDLPDDLTDEVVAHAVRRAGEAGHPPA